MPVPVIDCRTLSVSLTLNNFSHQMKLNYITTTHVEWFPLSFCVLLYMYVEQDEYLCWSVMSNKRYLGYLEEYTES